MMSVRFISSAAWFAVQKSIFTHKLAAYSTGAYNARAEDIAITVSDWYDISGARCYCCTTCGDVLPSDALKRICLCTCRHLPTLQSAISSTVHASS